VQLKKAEKNTPSNFLYRYGGWEISLFIEIVDKEELTCG
jgi:hypothetical protein